MDFKDYRTYERQRESIYDFLQTYEWDWFCSLNMAGHKSVSAGSYIKQFARDIGKQQHIRVCYAGVMVMHPQLHIHLLMAGLDQYGYTLGDKDKRRSERLWQKLSRGSAVIENVYDNGAAKYISFCNTPPEAFELIEPYGLKLLDKKRLAKSNPTLRPRKSSWHPYEYENIGLEAFKAMNQTAGVYSIDESEEIFEEPIP